MSATKLALFLCILEPLSLFLVSEHAFRRLKIPSLKSTRKLWISLIVKSSLVYFLYYFDLFYLYPATWLYPMFVMGIYPKEEKWWGLALICAVSSFFMPYQWWALGLNILPLLIGPAYLSKKTHKGFVDGFHYKLCLILYGLVISSFAWILYGKLWLGLSAEILWIILFAISLTVKFMQERESEHDISMDKVKRDNGEMMMTHTHLSTLGLISRGVIHEISNSLTIILAKIHYLKRHYSEEDLTTQLDDMKKSSERIKRTLDGMRLFYQSENNMGYDSFELREVISDVLLLCGQRFQNHGVSVRTYNIDGIHFTSRRSQLELALLQLLNNSFDAIEFLPQKWIEISAKRTANKVEIFIKDSGNGIPDDVAKNMMAPFYSTKEQGKALGTGLAMAQGIVQKSGGDLTYIRSPHTLFKIELPIDSRSLH